jgi:hypothetical protein
MVPMMIGMMVQMVAMQGPTEAHIILVNFFSNTQVLYVIQYLTVKPRLMASAHGVW